MMRIVSISSFSGFSKAQTRVKESSCKKAVGVGPRQDQRLPLLPPDCCLQVSNCTPVMARRRVMTKITRNITNRTLAICAVAADTPPKPKTGNQ